MSNAQGKPVEVSIPYAVYQEMLDLAVSMEIFQQDDTQESIARARNDVKRKRIASFTNAEEATAWLKGK